MKQSTVYVYGNLALKIAELYFRLGCISRETVMCKRCAVSKVSPVDEKTSDEGDRGGGLGQDVGRRQNVTTLGAFASRRPEGDQCIYCIWDERRSAIRRKVERI